MCGKIWRNREIVKIKMASSSSLILNMLGNRSSEVEHEQYWIFIAHVRIIIHF